LRFNTTPELVAAAKNAPPLKKGATGRAVHLVQFALLDLGYSMPRSTGGSMSPDGIYGDETVAIVKDFQRKQGLGVDGIVGKNTMAALDTRFEWLSHRVRLHFISISLATVPFEESFSKAQKVYGQYGIDIQFGSGRSLLLTPAETAMFERIDQQCNWELTSGEYDKLHRLGPTVPAFEIKVYFVDKMRGVLGCGGHAPGRPAATVAKEAWRWDMGHEVGHVLLTKTFTPVHHPHQDNLMNAFPANNEVVKLLTDAQVRKIRTHPCCKRQYPVSPAY
jgi:hypothetical protein